MILAMQLKHMGIKHWMASLYKHNVTFHDKTNHIVLTTDF